MIQGNKVAITGVGETPFLRKGEHGVMQMMARASLAAIADAGLTPQDIDGYISNRYTGHGGDEIAYAIGVAEPMSFLVDTHGTGQVDERKLDKILPQLFRLTPTNIRRTLKLNRPIYRRTAAYGHFGRAPDKDGGFSWEKTDLAAQIKSAVR